MKLKIKYGLQFVIAVILIVIANISLKDDFYSFMGWWIVLLLLGIIFLPLTQRIFSSFHDNGYLFSKTIGIAISGYLMWLLSSIRIMKFSSFSCVLIVTFCLFINAFIWYKNKKDERKKFLEPEKISSMVTEELLFFAIFLFWIYLRGCKPEAYGTEKFMDYGFMTSMMRADYMPPQDLWFAGKTINYYYLGQYMATYLTKLSFVSVNVGYNLMLMTLAAFAFVLPYSLIFNVMKNYLGKNYKEHTKIPAMAGLLSGATVTFAGNMHFTLFYWVVPAIRDILGMEGEFSNYWFPDSTRYIGYTPDTTDKTIHEFPSYSFILGDLHAHVINIMFVITVLGILYAWLLCRKQRMQYDIKNKIIDKQRVLYEIFHPGILLIGFFIGLFHTTNFWDFPIYFVVSGAVILFSNAVVYGFKNKALLMTAAHGVVITVIAELVALPFTLNFEQISTELNIATSHTPMYQLVILWGLPCALIIGLMIQLITIFKQRQRELTQLNTKETGSKHSNVIVKFMTDLHVSDLFIVTIGLCAIGLVLIPEVIYVKDIYSGDYKRANTMFKLTYQAFIMFGICTGFIIVKFLKFNQLHWQRKFTVITLLCLLSSMWYSKVAISAWYINADQTKNYIGLDAAAFMETTMPDDYLATNWLNDNIKGTPIIVEANGDSYTDYQRVSVVTGLPTILGWYTHEWLWRGNNEVVDARAADILTIYTSTDKDQVLSLIKEYNIEYIYVGKLEQDKYTTVNHTLLKEVGKVVFTIPVTQDKTYETYIVHVIE